MLIEWNENMSVGIPTIDEHHQHLVTLINRLFDAMRDEHGEQVVAEVLQELGRYVQYHFDYEEGLMQQYGYPQCSEHQQEHQQLAQQLSAFQEKFERHQVGVTIEMMHFLRDWLQSHIMQSDMGYSTFLQQQMEV